MNRGGLDHASWGKDAFQGDYADSAAAIRAAAPNLGPDGPAAAEHAYQSLATFVQPFTGEGRDAA